MKRIDTINGQLLGVTFKEKTASLKKVGAVAQTGNIYIEDLICLEDRGAWARLVYVSDLQDYRSLKAYNGKPKAWYTLINAKNYVNTETKDDFEVKLSDLKHAMEHGSDVPLNKVSDDILLADQIVSEDDVEDKELSAYAQIQEINKTVESLDNDRDRIIRKAIPTFNSMWNALGHWACHHSPVGFCVYDSHADPAHDECLYCGDPEERK